MGESKTFFDNYTDKLLLKVDVQSSNGGQTGALMGIFVKHVTPGTAAAKTGQFKVLAVYWIVFIFFL